MQPDNCQYKAVSGYQTNQCAESVKFLYEFHVHVAMHRNKFFCNKTNENKAVP